VRGRPGPEERRSTAEIADGATTLPADKALQESQVVEATVQECADDLHEVTATLARGIADIKQVEVALTRSRAAARGSRGCADEPPGMTKACDVACAA